MRGFLLLITLPLLPPLPPALAAQTRAPLTPFAERKAVVLLRDKTPCLGCHELDGEGGRLAPSLTTIGERRDAAYVRAIIADPQRVVPGSAMPKSRMDAATRELITAYLSRKARSGEPPMPRPPVAENQEPSVIYRKWCSGCHGPLGGGNGPNATYLPVAPAVHSSAAAMGGRSDDALFDAIAGGGSVMGKSPRMPAFQGTLTTAQMRALVGYIRDLCRCTGPAWSRDDAPPAP